MIFPLPTADESYLCYARHAIVHFARSQPPLPSVTINFDRLKDEIPDLSPSNVLILLDYCYAAIGSMGKRHDLISDSSFGEVGAPCLPHDFTDNIVQHLQQAYKETQILTTVQLYNRLAIRHFVMKRNGTPGLANMPIFLHHHSSRHLPIFLLPMQPINTPPWHLYPAATTGVLLQPVNVIFSVNLNNTEIQELGAMQAWSGSRHEASQHIRVGKVYRSSWSIIDIITTTFTIWYHLPQDPTINFIGFEYDELAASRHPWAEA
ncbi:uncharacterized protein FFUJ_05261 [Fusarium fujikuroi IMI 58289]|uniref:Uncharacterized protein n=1 Tax=Gibberella fujikuroi (strain CBS 195.34 / IMI 58289 / NRRL A-6831) TaxID=1279085 RepID=S0DSQ1_GIBF5|nr:uncharacterized protein FFUJ_05261 [Fusarium fujikuroi IMI 58289]KLP19735.1 uncharacterized protein LW94_7103 [Fusarium fujikuroi]CCT63593.1 uncharacterized protein FFUJ_05261 [Fusarium fujikuroi IMI 58289]SCN98186.1 uncharacterized protein FFM5_06736 [Fusarium fujikuroi]SCO39028.1 uncharacterized protein FFMR_05489 [Fusarium fujikuroi]